MNTGAPEIVVSVALFPATRIAAGRFSGTRTNTVEPGYPREPGTEALAWLQENERVQHEDAGACRGRTGEKLFGLLHAWRYRNHLDSVSKKGQDLFKKTGKKPIRPSRENSLKNHMREQNMCIGEFRSTWYP